MGEESVFLEYGVDLSFIRGHIGNFLPVKDDLTLIGIEEAAKDTEQCGLAAAGGAQQGHEFIFINIQIDALQNDLAVFVAFHDVFELNEFFLHFISSI